MGASGAAASLPSAARAQAHQDFTRLPIEPFYAELEPGTLCDFSQAVESLGGTVIRIRIYDTGGNKVKAVLIGDETIRHTNLDTGFSLVEELHGTLHRDFVTGEETQTGLFWHARSPDGRLVLAGAGRTVVDLSTEELVESTPNVKLDASICAALASTVYASIVKLALEVNELIIPLALTSSRSPPGPLLPTLVTTQRPCASRAAITALTWSSVRGEGWASCLAGRGLSCFGSAEARRRYSCSMRSSEWDTLKA